MYSELDRVLLQEQNAGLTLPDVIPTSIARVVTTPLHMILAEHMLLFAKTWTSRIATWTPWGERLSITSLLEEIEMIQNTCYGLECPKCLYHVNAVYGSGFVGYPGEATLRDDVLAGSKGDEAKAVIERYPDSVARLTSHFYHCPKCGKLSNHIRTIIYANKGWANDYNLFTEKVICQDCNVQLEEIPWDAIFSISCPVCKSILSVISWGYWG